MKGKLLFWVLLPLAIPGMGQPARVADLAAGNLLVAPRDSPDPSFAETVILLVDYDRQGAMGLILNRQTTVPLSAALREIKAARKRSDPIFSGGPVEMTTVMALLRSRIQPEEARHVFADVQLVTSKPLLEKSLKDAKSTEFRVFLGYTGWGPGQLQREVQAGAWHIFRGDAAAAFDPSPGSMWPRLIRRTEAQMASAGCVSYRMLKASCQ